MIESLVYLVGMLVGPVLLDATVDDGREKVWRTDWKYIPPRRTQRKRTRTKRKGRHR